MGRNIAPAAIARWHERTIAATDKQIDGLVRELHGLSDAEIRMAEGRA